MLSTHIELGEPSKTSSYQEVSIPPNNQGGPYVCVKQIDLARNRLTSSFDTSILAAWKLLSHKNVLNLYDYYVEGPILCLDLEVFQSENLVNFIWKQKAPINEENVLKIISEIVTGLIYAHQHDTLHGCLRTESILISENFDVKISGFGIAKFLTKDWFSVAPEVTLGQPYSAASEVWSLGCICYELLTKVEPFSNLNPFNLSQSIIEYSIQDIEGEYSPELKKLVFQMLEKNPQDRISLTEVGNSLKLILDLFLIKRGVPMDATNVIPKENEVNDNGQEPIPFKRKNRSQSAKSQTQPDSELKLEKLGIIVEDYLRKREIPCVKFDTGNDFDFGTILLNFKMKTLLNSFKRIYVVSNNSEAFVVSSTDTAFILLSRKIKKIGQNCFAWMKLLEEIFIFHPFIEIDENAFFECKSLRRVELPNSLKKIGNSAFSSCSAIEKLYLPKTLCSIGERCFQGCTNLVQLWVPKALNKVGNHAFVGCPYLFEREGKVDFEKGAKFNKTTLRAYSF